MATKTFTQFRVDNVVTTLPTTLAYGEEVYYKDSNGNLTLWVGHEDGSAWPSVGYKEYVAIVAQTGTNAPVATVLSDTIGGLSWTRADVGTYSLISASSAFAVDKVTPNTVSILSGQFVESMTIINMSRATTSSYQLQTISADISQDVANPTDGILSGFTFSIRIYP